MAGQNPEMYKCQNPDCTRTTPLLLKDPTGLAGYQVPDVPAGKDPATVHRVTEPEMGSFALLCSACAHYTVVNSDADGER